jgi:methylenetetrahydrofolate dehydrogenase (NADP+)/methenyltetrahydrofolate cyclohydrolase
VSAILIDGRAAASRILRRLRERTRALLEHGTRPHLTVLHVGAHPASAAYLESQRRHAKSASIEFSTRRLREDASAADVERELEALSADSRVHGILLPLPLPALLDAAQLQARIDPRKDVEGVNPENLGRLLSGRPGIVPCTAASVLEILEPERLPLEGAEVVVVGHSTIVGKPVALLLLDRFATTTVCHVGTRDLASHTRRAEVLIVAVGKPGLVRGDMIRPGAVVIDVGTTRVQDPDGSWTIRGDVVLEEALPVASRITPVPGGVGPVTVALLLRNVVDAAERLSTGSGAAV